MSFVNCEDTLLSTRLTNYKSVLCLFWKHVNSLFAQNFDVDVGTRKLSEGVGVVWCRCRGVAEMLWWYCDVKIVLHESCRFVLLWCRRDVVLILIVYKCFVVELYKCCLGVVLQRCCVAKLLSHAVVLHRCCDIVLWCRCCHGVLLYRYCPGIALNKSIAVVLCSYWRCCSNVFWLLLLPANGLRGLACVRTCVCCKKRSFRWWWWRKWEGTLALSVLLLDEDDDL